MKGQLSEFYILMQGSYFSMAVIECRGQGNMQKEVFIGFDFQGRLHNDWRLTAAGSWKGERRERLQLQAQSIKRNGSGAKL